MRENFEEKSLNKVLRLLEREYNNVRGGWNRVTDARTV